MACVGSFETSLPSSLTPLTDLKRKRQQATDFASARRCLSGSEHVGPQQHRSTPSYATIHNDSTNLVESTPTPSTVGGKGNDDGWSRDSIEWFVQGLISTKDEGKAVNARLDRILNMLGGPGQPLRHLTRGDCRRMIATMPERLNQDQLEQLGLGYLTSGGAGEEGKG